MLIIKKKKNRFLRHKAPFLIPDRIVGNSNKIKTHSENKIFLILIFKNKTSIASKSDFLWPYILRQPSHKILTLSSVIFLSLFFVKLLRWKRETFTIPWNMKKRLLHHLGFFCSTVSFGCSANSMILFQNMAILLSSSEPLWISQVSYIDSVDDYSSPWLINALQHLILHYTNTSKEIEK